MISTENIDLSNHYVRFETALSLVIKYVQIKITTRNQLFFVISTTGKIKIHIFNAENN